MNTKKLTKLLALYLPYILLGMVATNFGEAWRLAEGEELGDKIMSMMGTIPMAFANPLPSLHPLDLLVVLCCGAGLRLAVYLRGKNAKKYRHGMEYGSARWGTPKDIEPFMAPKFADNIILTKTERLMLMMLYNTGTRLGLIHELRLMQCYLMPDETALRELSEGVIEKLKLLTDAEFAELEFPPD